MADVKSVAIRSAFATDLDEVAAVWHASASGMDAAASPMPSLADLRARIDAELLNRWQLYVALDETGVVGMLAISRGEAVLDQIFVRPDLQRTGIGTALIEFAKRLMPAGFTLRMASKNERADRFYMKAGLTASAHGAHPQSGRPVRYYRWDGGTSASCLSATGAKADDTR